MTSLKFPRDTSQNYYHAYQEGASMSSDYFSMNDLQGSNIISTVFNSSMSSPPYRHLKYIDLDQPLENETQPFLNSMSPFTIDLTVDLDLEDADTYFDKSRVFFSIGHQVFGKAGGVITVGTNASDTSNKRRPVVGVTTETSTIKSLPLTSSIELDNSGVYTFKLVFNPQTEGNNRLMLFLKKGDDSFNTQCHGFGLSINYNYNITKPRLYLHTSGWTNEYGWNNTFDYSYGTLTDQSLTVSNGVFYSQEFLMESLADVVFEQPSMEQPDGIAADSGVISTDTNVELYL